TPGGTGKMPVYVYRNLVTGETLEIEQRMTEAALTEHPETGEPVKRLIQPVGIAFKGSGFYVNDSRSKPASADSSASSSSSADGAERLLEPHLEQRLPQLAGDEEDASPRVVGDAVEHGAAVGDAERAPQGGGVDHRLDAP